MEAVVNRVEFLKRIKIIEKAISENKIKPIISCAYIETKENKMVFYGTNLEITITTFMETEIKEQGKIVFQHHIVEEYLKELKDEMITLKASDNILTIETEESATEFSLMNSEEFPRNYMNTELEKEGVNLKINTELLVEAFEKTKFAASQNTDDMRINCIRIEGAENNIKFVGTDTYRLVYFEREIDVLKEFKVSLPLNTADALIKLLKTSGAEDLEVSVTDRNIKFELSNLLVTSRIVDLSFPDYQGIFNQLSYDKTLKIQTRSFLNMLKRVIIFVRQNSESKNGAIYELDENKILITGSNEIAKINEEAIVDYQGEKIKISLNTKFLIDFLQNLNSEKNLIVEFINQNGSVKIVEENENKYIYIVMPLSLKS
jgi:DNA polymerase-3 subunit beta